MMECFSQTQKPNKKKMETTCLTCGKNGHRDGRSSGCRLNKRNLRRVYNPIFQNGEVHYKKARTIPPVPPEAKKCLDDDDDVMDKEMRSNIDTLQKNKNRCNTTLKQLASIASDHIKSIEKNDKTLIRACDDLRAMEDEMTENILSLVQGYGDIVRRYLINMHINRQNN